VINSMQMYFSSRDNHRSVAAASRQPDLALTPAGRVPSVEMMPVVYATSVFQRIGGLCSAAQVRVLDRRQAKIGVVGQRDHLSHRRNLNAEQRGQRSPSVARSCRGWHREIVGDRKVPALKGCHPLMIAPLAVASHMALHFLDGRLR